MTCEPHERAALVRITRPVVLLLGATVVAGAIVVAVATALQRTGGPGGPVVFYEVLDTHRLSLFEQALDGRTHARLVASRPSTGEGQVRWEVDPGGSVALVISRTPEGAMIEAVEIAGGRSVWRRDVDRMPWPGVWSSDGSQWASMTEPQHGQGDQHLVADVAAGTTRTFGAEARWWPQGFTADGDLVLTEEIPGALGDVESWRFRVVDRATGAILAVDASAAATTPRTRGPSDAATAAGWAVRTRRTSNPEDDNVVRLEMIDLRTGKGIFVGPSKHMNYGWLALTRDASRIVALAYVPVVDGESQSVLIVIDCWGEGTEVWRGTTPIEAVLSRDGRYLGLNTLVDGPALTVVHLGTGRSVEIPLPARSVAAAIRVIVDPTDNPLIATAADPPEPE